MVFFALFFSLFASVDFIACSLVHLLVSLFLLEQCILPLCYYAMARCVYVTWGCFLVWPLNTIHIER